jgi:dTDP-4-amino-4,6-dideoxygalactose transaminase
MERIAFFDGRAQAQRLQDEVLPIWAAIWHSGQYTSGPYVEQFETAFAAYCGAGHCVACHSGTAALHLALAALGIARGDEVIVPAMTFIATAWAVQYAGARLVLADIDPLRRTLDPQDAARRITPRTRAIVAVHLYGQPADMSPLWELARSNGLAIIEDAAQAHGARYQGRPVGSLGRAAAFSFYPSKNLGGCGEGGAVVTDDADLAAKARALRNHAQRSRYVHETLGFNYRLNELNAAVLGVKLRYLDEWNACRRRLHAAYLEGLSGIKGVWLPLPAEDSLIAPHLLVVESPWRDALRHSLTERGIGTGLHYPLPLHLQPALAHLGYKPGDFPHAERLAAHCLSLPLYPELEQEAVQKVCAATREFLWSRPSADRAPEQGRARLASGSLDRPEVWHGAMGLPPPSSRTGAAEPRKPPP